MSQELLGAFDQLLVRIRCGETYAQATRDLPRMEVPARWARTWQGLRDRVLSGELLAEAAVESFAAQIRVETEVARLLTRKSRLPRVQSQVIVGIGILFWLASQFLFPPILRAGWKLSLLTAAIFGVGAYASRRLVAAAEKGLWFTDWALFLQELSSSLRCGRTLAPSMAAALERDLDLWPRELRAKVAHAFSKIRHHEDVPEDLFAVSPKAPEEIRLALEQLKWIVTLHQRGQPLAGTLAHFAEDSRRGLEDKIQTQADNLSLKLLMPLFLAFVPGYLLLLFGPLLSMLLEGF